MRRTVFARTMAPILAFGLLAAGCSSGGPASSSTTDAAKGYPKKSIKYILPFDAGGESDITARLQQKPLQDILGTNVVVSYKPGAGGALGWSELTRTSPDGYTIMGSNLPHIILQPLLRANAGYKTSDLKQVYIFESTPNALLVPADSPIKTLDDFIAAAKKDPGAMTVGGSGEDSANWIGTLDLGDKAGVKLTYTPFSGTGTAIPALLGNHVKALMTYTPQIAQLGDKVRAIAVAADKRMTSLPDVPTFKEQGFDIVDGAYRGVSVPKTTPDAIVQKLAAAFKKANSDPTLVQKFEKLGFVVENYGPTEAAQLTQEREAVYGPLLKKLKLIK